VLQHGSCGKAAARKPFNAKEPLIKSFLPFFAALSVTDFRVLLKTAKR